MSELVKIPHFYGRMRCLDPLTLQLVKQVKFVFKEEKFFKKKSSEREFFHAFYNCQKFNIFSPCAHNGRPAISLQHLVRCNSARNSRVSHWRPWKGPRAIWVTRRRGTSRIPKRNSTPSTMNPSSLSSGRRPNNELGKISFPYKILKICSIY